VAELKKAALSTHAWAVHSALIESPPELPPQPEPPDFAAIFREYAPFVWRALRRLGVSERDAEDVLQEVFLVVHRKLSSFQARSSLRTWVYGICVFKALDHRRLARVQREVMDCGVPDRAGDPTQEHSVELGRARAKLDALLEQLDDAKRTVFVLFEWEGLSMQEIAELMGTPVQTAYSRLYAARREVLAGLSQGEQ
jgi:RNA polymerase sigma-70 factor, ECF subfamily